jgi:hypothetical protein
VRRRICILGLVLSAALLALAGVAVAAKPGPKAPFGNFKPVATSTCKIKAGIVIAAGDSSVTPPVSKGAEFGSATCGKVFGKGVQQDKFTVPQTGLTNATFQLYFPTGTIRGKYVLTPQEGDFSPTSFTETQYLGQMTITGGTGTYQGASGVGKMTCTTLDQIHLTCTDRLQLKQL